ncbi:glycosyl hydrolase family 28-related protein [Sphingomonas sp. ac-8]|uniref:glycosyl hydrolase family 28-related protein n=1 Tax=Sphingomonas sp. ac-8 TaxID=3242977 RepID=UPI003A7FC739
MSTTSSNPPSDDDRASVGNMGTNVSRRLALGAAAGLCVLSSTSSSGLPQRVDPAPFRPKNVGSAVSPEDYGAAGNGRTDDTTALQAAFDTGASIHLAPGKSYLVTGSLTLSKRGVSLSGGGRIKVARNFRTDADSDGNGSHMRVLFVTAADISITDIVFDALDAPLGSAVENGLIWTTAPSTTIRGCRFLGNPKGTCIWSLGNAPYLSVIGCQFIECSGAVFAKGRNTLVSDNVIVNATDAAIAVNGVSCVGSVIANNAITNEKMAMIPSMIAVEEGASGWTITGNTLLGVNGGGIVCTNVLDASPVRGGVIANNVINARRFDQKLPGGRNPAGLLSITNSYVGWIMHDNQVSGCPTGNSNSRLVLIAASGGTFHDNVIDGTDAGDLSAMITILPGTGGLSIRNNRTVAGGNGRHFLFAAGNYGNMPCTFEGGHFLGGGEGINAELESRKIEGLRLHIRDIADTSAKSFISAASILGDRSAFLNAGAWARPHRIGTFTDMACNAVPTNAGTMAFQPGDKFYFLVPRPGKPICIVRTQKGWSGFGGVA